MEAVTMLMLYSWSSSSRRWVAIAEPEPRRRHPPPPRGTAHLGVNGNGRTVRDSHPASEHSMAVANAIVTALPLVAPSSSHRDGSCGGGGGFGWCRGDERKTEGTTSSRDLRYNVSSITVSRYGGTLSV